MTTTESSGEVEITVARLGDASGEADVDYSTRGVTASERSDFTIAAGRLHFAPFETAKSFPVLITEDSLVEGQEFAQIILDDPLTGATVDLTQLVHVRRAMELVDLPAHRPDKSGGQWNRHPEHHRHQDL